MFAKVRENLNVKSKLNYENQIGYLNYISSNDQGCVQDLIDKTRGESESSTGQSSSLKSCMLRVLGGATHR